MISQEMTSTPPRTNWTKTYLPGIEYVFLFLLATLLLWKGVIPGCRTLNTDFPNYYVAARLIREHYNLDRLYEWIWFQRAADHLSINQGICFLGLTPFSAFSLIPVSALPALVAKRIWIVFNVALLAGAVECLSRQTGVSRRRAWIIALLSVIPLRTSFLYGQMHILVMALLVAAYVSHMRGRQIISGSCIAVAAALKIYPAFFCLYFLVKRRWQALGSAIVGMGLCLILSYLVAGPGATRAYLFEQLPRSLQGESLNPFLPVTTSSAALFHRLFLYEPELNPHPLIFSPRLYAIVYPLWQAVLAGIVLVRLRPSVRADEREGLEWSMFLCLLMFLSSSPASYQFVVLIAVAIPTIAVLIKNAVWKTLLLYLSFYFLACNIRAIPINRPGVSIVTPFFYFTLWSGVALLIIYCFLLKAPVTHSRSLFRKPAVQFVGVVLGLWILGGYSAWSHLRNMRMTSADLISPRDGALLRSNPVSASEGGLMYVGMIREGYRVREIGRPLTIPSAEHEGLTDQLSFAASTSAEDVWVETASSSGSQVVHLANVNLTGCQITDGENPVLSRDGSVLGFLREYHGHGSLWKIELSDCTSTNRKTPARITPPSFDVRTLAAGLGDRFLVSGIHEGEESIFEVSSDAAPQLLAESDNALNSPALSPDGKLLAMREQISHRWQLVSLDLSSRYWKQLTYGDCNAYTPSWQDNHTLLYATDCMRGLGLTALVSLKLDR